jgi:aspartate racemase
VRKLGMIGGMSWASTHRYYEHLNKGVQQARGGAASAPLLIESLNFERVYRLDSHEQWDDATKVLIETAQRLEQAGAGALIIAANSMHRVYRQLEAAVDVPIIHIAECVGAKMESDGIKTAALLGTRNVMIEGFYRRRLIAHGVNLLAPALDVVEELDRIIYDELMQGRATRNAERSLRTMITNKEKDGAEAIILACTELEMIVDVDANLLPIYDSTRIHADAAVRWILGEDSPAAA